MKRTKEFVKLVVLAIAILTIAVIVIPTMEMTFGIGDGSNWQLAILDVTDPMKSILMITLGWSLAGLVALDRVFAIHFGKNKAFALTTMITFIVLPLFGAVWTMLRDQHLPIYWADLVREPSSITSIMVGVLMASLSYWANGDTVRRRPLPRGEKKSSTAATVAAQTT